LGLLTKAIDFITDDLNPEWRLQFVNFRRW